MMLTERVSKFLAEMGVPMTVFAAKVKLSTRAIYAWKKGDLVLSSASLKRIDDYLTKYRF